MRSIYPAILMMILMVSCDSSRIYEKFKKIDQYVWKADDIKKFEVPITDTSLNYQVYINIRNSSKYEFRNLWGFFTIKAPNGQTKRDTFEIILANELGEWRGSGLGNVNSVRQQYFRDPVKFPVRGIYTFQIQQAMRKEDLKEILDVGLRVESQ